MDLFLFKFFLLVIIIFFVLLKIWFSKILLYLSSGLTSTLLIFIMLWFFDNSSWDFFFKNSMWSWIFSLKSLRPFFLFFFLFFFWGEMFKAWVLEIDGKDVLCDHYLPNNDSFILTLKGFNLLLISLITLLLKWGFSLCNFMLLSMFKFSI